MSARQGNSPLGPDYWDVNQAATRLTAFACTVSARHLSHGMERMQFNREIAYFSKRIMDDVATQRLTPEEGLKALKAEQASLLIQAEKLALPIAGLMGGISQVASGAGACVKRRMLCTFFGAPLLAHGANNLYENGNHIGAQRGDVVGPVRRGYQQVAKKLGYSERDGNLLYYTVDLGLSGYGVFFRKELKPGAWRLFKYHNIDKMRGFRMMGKPTLFLEGVVSAATMHQWFIEYFRE